MAAIRAARSITFMLRLAYTRLQLCGCSVPGRSDSAGGLLAAEHAWQGAGDPGSVRPLVCLAPGSIESAASQLDGQVKHRSRLRRHLTTGRGSARGYLAAGRASLPPAAGGPETAILIARPLGALQPQAIRRLVAWVLPETSRPLAAAASCPDRGALGIMTSAVRAPTGAAAKQSTTRQFEQDRRRASPRHSCNRSITRHRVTIQRTIGAVIL